MRRFFRVVGVTTPRMYKTAAPEPRYNDIR